MEKNADICIGNFELWIYGREFPEADDYWDGNWLNSAARCSTASSQVGINGPFIHLTELRQWLTDLKDMYASLEGEARLKCMEPNLDLSIKVNKRGNCTMTVHITPDPLCEQHVFVFADLDQSYLLPVIDSLEKIFKIYPLKGTE